MMYLIDTNIFLEILLGQERKEASKSFLRKHSGELFISDFSLHSIGVVLYRLDRMDQFTRFVEDMQIDILTLSRTSYKDLEKTCKDQCLDFDDSYQYEIAKENDLDLVTYDKDFSKCSGMTVIAP